jgi:hypothetical protein
MDDLIEALQIFKKYAKTNYELKFPTYCEHEVLHVCVSGEVSEEDAARLNQLGFSYSKEDGWLSFHFGSC